MPKVDVRKAEIRTVARYPGGLHAGTEGREKVMVGDVCGLTQFGVNLTRLKPGAWSAHRHWHENEDEFVYILQGECVLIENEGETILKAGDCAGFKAGVDNGHCLVNKSNADVLYLEIGTRATSDVGHYPDDDLRFERDGTAVRVLHKSGEPY